MNGEICELGYCESEGANVCVKVVLCLCKCIMPWNYHIKPYHLLCNYHYFVMTIFMAMIVEVLLYFVCISVKA